MGVISRLAQLGGGDSMADPVGFSQENQYLAVTTPLGDDVLILQAVRGTEGFDAILLHAGNEALGWHEDGKRIVPMIVHEYVGAWRV